MRLQFANEEHISLVNRAPSLLIEFKRVTRPSRILGVRVWSKPGPLCEKCRVRLEKNDPYVRLRNRVFHRTCLGQHLESICADLAALGFKPEAENAN